MGKFYNSYFPPSIHKLSLSDMETAMKTLKLGYSDNIMSTIFQPMIHLEEKNPTFKHLANWNELSLIEKANKILITSFLKMLSVIDFPNMTFKEVLSLSEEVETCSY